MQALWGPFIGSLTQKQVNGFFRHVHDPVVKNLREKDLLTVDAFWRDFRIHMEGKSEDGKFWYRKKFKHVNKPRKMLAAEKTEDYTAACSAASFADFSMRQMCSLSLSLSLSLLRLWIQFWYVSVGVFASSERACMTI